MGSETNVLTDPRIHPGCWRPLSHDLVGSPCCSWAGVWGYRCHLWPPEMLLGRWDLLSQEREIHRGGPSSWPPLPWVCLASSGVHSLVLLWEKSVKGLLNSFRIPDLAEA